MFHTCNRITSLVVYVYYQHTVQKKAQMSSFIKFFLFYYHFGFYNNLEFNEI